MLNNSEKIVAVCSTILRASAFIFLRWIPGHHFPPLILTVLVLYLSLIYTRSEKFGRKKPSLHEAFPTVLKQQKIVVQHAGRRRDVDRVEIDYEDPVIYEDEYPFLKTILLGIPDWREWEFSYLTIGMNILLALFSFDMVFRGPVLYPSEDLRFSRVGFVDIASANVLFREPDSQQLPVFAYLKQHHAVDWTKVATAYYAGEETDYTHPLKLTGLDSDTEYMYWLSNNLTGTFRTAPAPGSLQARSLTFLTSSCIKANFPYRPSSHALEIHGFQHLSTLIRSLPSIPAFMLFLGDFIYVDVPQRLSSSFSHYRSEYRRVYASPSWKLRGLESVPWLHTLDDHEIANDWSGGNQTAPFPAASDPFIHYHVSVNPPVPPSSPIEPESNTTYFQFTRGPASFFMLDTRRYRTNPEQGTSAATGETTAKPLYGSSESTSKPPSAEETPASMLGKTQLIALLTFLRTPEPPGVYWKFVASSVPFTKSWRFGTSDTWGGFLTERSQILTAMHESEARLGVRVIVLSGDRHEFAAIRFPPAILHFDSLKTAQAGLETQESKTVYDHTPQSGPHEFSVGPLSMFYLPIRTFRQTDQEDVALKYLPDGNSKIGVIDIQNLAGPTPEAARKGPFGWFGSTTSTSSRAEEGDQKSILKYSLWIDGSVAWEYMLTSPGPSYKPVGSRK